MLRGVGAALRLRPHRSGVGVQLTARTIELLHLDAPTPHLVHCLARAPARAADAEGDMLSLALELAPLHSAAPLHMVRVRGRVRGRGRGRARGRLVLGLGSG